MLGSLRPGAPSAEVRAASDPSESLERYRAMAASVPGIAVKGKANPYTALNGTMFSFLDQSGVICLRLPKAQHTAFLAKYGPRPVAHRGAVTEDYVAIPDTVARDPAALAALFAISVAYAETLD